MAYTKTTDFASKDSLLTGDPAKVVKGSEIDAEFDNIEAAIGTTTGSGAVVLATSPTLVTPDIGTPSSGVVTNLTGTANININGTVGATTPAAGTFTTLTATGDSALGNASGDAHTITGAITHLLGTLSHGTTDWPTTVLGKSGNRVLIGNEGVLALWNENNAVGAYCSLYLGAKHNSVATAIAGGLIRGGTESTNYSGFLSFLTQNAAGTYVENLRITSAGDRVANKATSQYASGSDGYAILSGGSSASLGASIVLFGESHATAANELHLRNAGNTTRVKLDANGNLLVGVTSATSSGGKIETSNGLTFPATQSACANANTLDDYEEGTWTATVTFGGANVGMTYATRTAHYVKVGSTCFFQLYLRLSAKGSSTGLAVVGGLPFTSDGSSAYSAVAVSIYDPIAGTAIASTTATVGSSSTNISLYSTTGGTLLYLTQGSFTDDTAVVVSGHYKVA